MMAQSYIKFIICLFINFQAVSGVLSPGGFWDQKFFYLVLWFSLHYNYLIYWFGVVKMWFKLLKINVLDSVYLNKNAYICSGIWRGCYFLRNQNGTPTGKNRDRIKMNADLLYMLKGCVIVGLACIPVAIIGAAIVNYFEFRNSEK